MQQLARSMCSFTWAMSLFGVQQSMNMVRPVSPESGAHPATEAFRALTDASVSQLGETMQIAFQGVDRLQQRLLDVGLSGLTLGTPGAAMKGASQAVNPLRRPSKMFSTGGFFGLGENSPTGWGPIPRVPL